MAEDFCKKCGSCCKNIVVDFEQKILYRDGKEVLKDTFAQMLLPKEKVGNKTVCICKFLKENLCTNSNKPDECLNFPSSPFAYLPEECGFAGYVFMKNENLRQKIRKYKEEIIHYDALISFSKNNDDKKQYQKIIDSHKKYIDKYKDYGSCDW